MPLTQLQCKKTKLSDLLLLKGMPLKDLIINATSITDLTPLKGMSLENIRLTPKNINRGLDILRDMKSLKKIGVESNQVCPAAEFWSATTRAISRSSTHACGPANYCGT